MTAFWRTESTYRQRTRAVARLRALAWSPTVIERQLDRRIVTLPDGRYAVQLGANNAALLRTPDR